MTQLATDLALPASQVGAIVDGLVDALDTERRLIEELIQIMRGQRDAVGRDDLQTVDDSVYAVQRVLFTLGEARKRRRSLNRRIGRPEDTPVRDLDAALGAHATPALRRSREALQSSARTLSQEVTVNRRVLREALAAGDDFVRQLYGAGDPRATYAETATGAATPAGGLLLNRRA
jgi:hypothetical protein